MVEVANGIVGKEVKLVYFDEEKAFRMNGRVLRYDEVFLTILSDGREQSIPIKRVIRLEVTP